MTGLEATGDEAQVTVKQGGQEKAVALTDIQFGTVDALAAYEYATVYDDLATARQFLAGYEASTLPIKTYRAAFDAAYRAGQSGVQATGESATYARMLKPQVWDMAYKAGQQASLAQDTRLEMDDNVQKSIRKAIEALPRYDRVEEGYTGAALGTTGKLNQAQATQIALLDQLGKKYGTVYAVVDSLESQGASIQGMFEPGSNRVVIALDAQEGNLLRVAGHESWHYIQENSQNNEAIKAQAEELQAFVLEKLQGSEDYDLEARIAEKTEQYRNAVGQELTREAAIEELMADSLVSVLATEENVRDLMEQHSTLGQKIMGFIKQFLTEVRRMLQRISKTNPEARAMLKQDEATLQQVAENFDRVMVSVNALKEAQIAGISITGEGNTAKYSIRDGAGHEVIMTQEDFEENKRSVAAMEPVIAIEGNAFPPTPGSKPAERINAYFDSIGNRAMNEVFGEVLLENTGAEHLANFMSQRKAALIPAIATVIEQGNVIDIDQNHKGKNYPTAVIAAPVTLDGESYYIGVAIRQLNQQENRYYIHEAALIQQKEGDYSASNLGAVADPASSSHLTIHSILQSIQKYNGENGKSNVSRAGITITGKGDTAKYSIRDGAGHEVIMTQEDFEENRRSVAAMEPVIAMEGNAFPPMPGSKPVERINASFDSIGNRAMNEVFGEVLLEKSGAKHLANFLSKRKAALIPAIKTVIEQGTVIDIDQNHKGKSFPTAVLAAPVELDGEKYYMGVGIRQLNGSDKRYYIHEAALVNENQADYLTQKPGAEAYPGSDNHPDVYTILQSIRKYNGENGKSDVSRAGITITGKGDKAKYSIRDGAGHEVIMTQEDFEENKRSVAAMEPVIAMEGNAFPPMPGSKPVERINASFDSIGNRAMNEVFGEVLLEKSGAEHLAGYMNRAKASLIPAIKTVIEKGTLVDIDGDHKGKGFPTAVIAAPVTLNEEAYYMGVAIRQVNGKENRYYIHEAAMINKKEGDYSTTKSGAASANQALANTTLSAPSSHPTIYTILQSIRKYNGENGKSDIKLSLKEVDADNGDMARLLEENQELRDMVRQLSRVMKGANLAKQETVTRRLAQRLKEEYATKVPLKVLTENLQKAFDVMHQAETTGQGEAAMKIMSDIALDMLQKSEIADDSAWQETKELRNRLRKGRIGLTETQWQEAKSLFGSAWNFRKAMMGKWMMPGEGKQGVTTLDMIWPEISQQYPQYFDAEASEGDMVAQVAEMFESAAVQYANPYGADIEQLASSVTMEIYYALMDARQVETENGAMDAMLHKTMVELEKAKEEIVKQKNRYTMLKEDERLKRRESKAAREARNSIIRNRDRIAKKLESPKAGAFVPYQLSSAVEGLMEALDFTRDGKKTISRELLEKAKEAYMNAPKEGESRSGMNDGPLAAFYNGDLEETFNELIDKTAGKTARDMTLDELELLKEVVGGYAAMIVNEDKLFTQERRDSLRETGDQLITELYTRKEHKVQGGAVQWLQNGVSRGLLKPVTVFEQLKGTAMEPVWTALRKAEGKHIQNVNEAAEYLQEALKTYHQQESINREGKAGKRKDNAMAQKITLQSGETIRLTDQELMTLYATYKREKLVGTKHLLGGGFTLENAPKGSSLSPIRVTEEDLSAMGKLLTEEQKAYVEQMVQYLSTTCAEWGNEVTRQLYGVEKFGEGYYIPFSVVRNSVAEDPASPQDARIKVCPNR